MAAYAALHALKLSVQEFLVSEEASFLPQTQLQLVQSAHHEMDLLLNHIDEFERGGAWGKALLEGIRNAVWRLEDMFDEHLISTCSHPLELFAIDDLLQTEMHSFIQILSHAREEQAKIWLEQVRLKLKEHKEDWLTDHDYDEGADDDGEEEEEEIVKYEEDVLQSTINYEMVGLVDEFIQLRRFLLLPLGGLHQVQIVGMVGIGKTAMAYQLCNDPLISKHFQRRAFVSVGRSPRFKQVFIDILSQLQDHLDTVIMQHMSPWHLRGHLVECLAHKRCLIVVDDVWSDGSFELTDKKILQESRILVTTRKKIPAHRLKLDSYFVQIELRLLSEDESWRLFCEKVFGKASPCPYNLVKLGKKIVENCEGLPLAIIAIADVLAQGEMSIDYWKKVSEDPNPLSIGANHQHPSLDSLYSSYEELDQSLQARFLYMGIFPRRQEIPMSKLTRLWEAERLVKPQLRNRSHRTLAHKQVMKILKTLSSQSVIFVTFATLQRGFKTCKLHSVFWHLCVSQARKEYIFHGINKFSKNSFQQDLHGHRRICVHNNALFGIKEANNLLLSMSNARSLVCTGPYHPYPVPMEFKMKLLRVLDLVTIRFYMFPSEVVQLLLLRYLAFTYNGMLHASISQLCNLESLIVERHTRIISIAEDTLYMPVEIWNMKKLCHLQVTGALLPHPYNGAVLPNLVSISKINARCLTTAVFDSIPNLLKLSLEVDLSAYDPFCFSDHLSRVSNLVSLKCVILNPKPRTQTVDPPSPSKIFPSRLSKLTLSGFGYPWRYIEELFEFVHLEVLKLRSYAFQGSEWEWKLGSFRCLKVLHLEDLDLVRWRVSRLALSTLKKLTIRHCYGLREIPSHNIKWSSLELIEVVDVQPSVVASVTNIVEQRKNKGCELQLNISC